MKKSTLRLTRGAVIAALYFALSAAVPVITYGPVQFRVAEALTLLPFFMPEAIWGVTLGCLLTNAFSAFGIYDVVFGTLTTLVAALITSKTAGSRRFRPFFLTPSSFRRCGILWVRTKCG